MNLISALAPYLFACAFCTGALVTALKMRKLNTLTLLLSMLCAPIVAFFAANFVDGTLDWILLAAVVAISLKNLKAITPRADTTKLHDKVAGFAYISG